MVVIDVAAAAAPAPAAAAAAASATTTTTTTAKEQSSTRVVHAPPPFVGKPVKFVPLTEGKGKFIDDWPAGEVAGKINTTTAK